MKMRAGVATFFFGRANRAMIGAVRAIECGAAIVGVWRTPISAASTQSRAERTLPSAASTLTSVASALTGAASTLACVACTLTSVKPSM